MFYLHKASQISTLGQHFVVLSKTVWSQWTFSSAKLKFVNCREYITYFKTFLPGADLKITIFEFSWNAMLWFLKATIRVTRCFFETVFQYMYVAQNLLLSKLLGLCICRKSSQKCDTKMWFWKKCDCPMGENSPNLVTLAAPRQDSISRLCWLRQFK
jgi:hypothetical protein